MAAVHVLEAKIAHTQESGCSRLPPELLDKIFLYLHFPPKWDKGGNRRNLCACRLVSRTWADVAFRHTYSAIRVYVDPYGSASVGCMSTKFPLQRLQAFFTASPSLCGVVEALVVISTATRAEPQPRNIDVSCFHLIISVFPRLQYLSLGGVCQRFAGIPSTPPKTRVSVGHVELPNSSRYLTGTSRDLVILLGMFEEIGELSIDGHWLAKIGLRAHAGHTRLHHLHCRGTGFTAIGTLARYLDIQHLQSLSIAPNCILVQPEAREKFFTMLQNVVPHLTRLGIYFGGLTDVRAPASIYAAMFSACTEVQTVCFSFGCHSPDPYKSAWGQLVAVIPHLPRSAHRLTLEVDFVAEIYLLRGVGNLRHEFEELVVARSPGTTVLVQPDDEPMFGIKEQTKIAALFPRLFADGLLQF